MQRRAFLKLSAFLAAAGAGLLAAIRPARANSYYSGPISDHFDGTHFFVPGGPVPKGFGDLLRWRVEGGEAKWPASYPSPFADAPPPRIVGKGLRITLIGHASFIVQTGGLNILIDPVFSERASPFAFTGPKRVNPPGVAFAALPKIDVVLVTHNHYDHLDLPTLERLWAEHRPRIVAPLGNDAIIRSGNPEIAVETADWRDVVDLGNGIRVHLEPSQHWSARGLNDRRHALWASFVIETPAGKVYAVGDTGFGDGSVFRWLKARHPDLRIGLLPIGAYEPRWFMKDQHINPDDAVDIFRILGLETALGYHWGTFQLTNEAIDEPPALLAAALAQHRIPAERFRPMRPGEVWSSAS